MPAFNLKTIETSLMDFKKAFPAINKRLSLHREPVDRELIQKVLEAYTLLNYLLKRDINLFSPAGLHSLLELNHVVLCGTDPDARTEYYSHILETRRKFNTTIVPLRKWVCSHCSTPDPYHLAAGFYCRSLSRPQVFIEGNHRTGNIILNYLLLSRGQPPLILSDTNAFDYLELSGKIKFSSKDTLYDKFRLLVGLSHHFRDFLESNAAYRFLSGSSK